MNDPTPVELESFVARWQAADGGELANYQLFVSELCELLDLPRAEPAREDTRDNAYVFERRVEFHHGEGTLSAGRIDCYRRGAFVLEAKRVRAAGAAPAYDSAMLRARAQAESYARALPAWEGRPPFLVVVDVGRSIELYAEFTRSGATYTPFPDPRSHRIALAQLREPAIRQRLRMLWLDPLALDPARVTGKATRAIAAHLAALARSLEEQNHHPETVAGFLTRCLFTLFAEDVGLLPPRAFSDLLDYCANQPASFIPLVGELWQAMDAGRFSTAVRAELLRFNGKLFKQPNVVPLTREQIGALIEAAHADWTQVEPAIFGTLLERALDPIERHALGAHYTPRAYVERLVMPTVIEPLRADWANVQAAAVLLGGEAKLEQARATVRAFHHKLCETKVLDPACGSGNFLYVAMEHMKRLEGEVLNQMESLGASLSLETEGLTVDPHQFLGLELNPRAAAITELVLWIGYLQWHFRTRGQGRPPIPVLRDFRNIECRDAVLAYDGVEYVLDERGMPVSRWDGRTMKKHPVTGEDVPDENARVPLERYLNPRKAQWPQADFVVGNPPYIGNKRMRLVLGDGYVEALRNSRQDVPDNADFVMYWWNHAAQLVRQGRLQRFGLITTNSLRQTFNRQVIEHHLCGDIGRAVRADQDRRAWPALRLAFAIPDHPWVDSADGAAVRVAMTVGAAGEGAGRLLTAEDETDAGEDNAITVRFAEKTGTIQADLTVGAKVSGAQPLMANRGIAFTGMYPLGQGFVLLHGEVSQAIGSDSNTELVVKPFVIARDLTQETRRACVIDFYPRSAQQARLDFPCLFQWVLDRVKPERDHNPRDSRRLKWWLFAEPVPAFREARSGLKRLIMVPRTAKWFTFQFVSADTVPDTSVVAIASDDAFVLGILSSQVHIKWALRTGGRLGVGNDPRYQHNQTFNPFPFSTTSPDQQSRIRDLAEQLDAHRKRQQAQHPELTLTGLYNVLEKLKAGEALSPKNKSIHEQGLVSVLKSLHDELDREVLVAYGWSDLAPLLEIANGNARPESAGYASREEALRALDTAVLERLVALNAERAAEEARGRVRWLRPEFQSPQAAPRQEAFEVEGEASAAALTPGPTPKGRGEKLPWPDTLPGQVAAVARLLAQSPAPLDVDGIAKHYTGRGRWKRRLPQLLETLVALGRARGGPQGYTAAS